MALYRVLIEQDEDGAFVAECPSLPGCVSEGATRDEAIENIKDAIAGYIESLRKHNEPIPPSIWEVTVEVPARAGCRSCRVAPLLRPSPKSVTS